MYLLSIKKLSTHNNMTTGIYINKAECHSGIIATIIQSQQLSIRLLWHAISHPGKSIFAVGGKSQDCQF